MKKNKTMRAAALLLAFTLITSCFVGNTFAKYTASGSASSAARVAYWGFDTTETVELGLFDFEDSGIFNGEENLIAPGSGNEVELKIAPAIKDANKAPEVDYSVNINTNNSVPPVYDYFGGIDGLVDWYIVVNGEKTTYDTWTKFIKGIGALDGNASGAQKYEANTKADILYGNAEEPIKIGWTWAFNDAGPDLDAALAKDAADTLTGNKALTTYGQVKLQINITVEQVN